MRQRKVDDDKVLQLIKEGKNQKQIADHFNVSPVAICKRLKRIFPKPKSLEKLTDKEQKFVVAVAEGKSRTQAVMDSFDVSSRESAKAMQNTLMQKDDIKIAIAELMQIFGLTRGYRVNKLKSHIDHVDPGISLKGLDMSFKLDGLYAPEKHINMNIDYPAISKKLEEIREERERLRQRREALLAEIEAEKKDGSKEEN
jgi:hypothetical protein